VGLLAPLERGEPVESTGSTGFFRRNYHVGSFC
jgi:hypothetical protein